MVLSFLWLQSKGKQDTHDLETSWDSYGLSQTVHLPWHDACQSRWSCHFSFGVTRFESFHPKLIVYVFFRETDLWLGFICLSLWRSQRWTLHILCKALHDWKVAVLQRQFRQRSRTFDERWSCIHPLLSKNRWVDNPSWSDFLTLFITPGSQLDLMPQIEGLTAATVDDYWGPSIPITAPSSQDVKSDTEDNWNWVCSLSLWIVVIVFMRLISFVRRELNWHQYIAIVSLKLVMRILQSYVTSSVIIHSFPSFIPRVFCGAERYHV